MRKSFTLHDLYTLGFIDSNTTVGLFDSSNDYLGNGAFSGDLVSKYKFFTISSFDFDFSLNHFIATLNLES